MKEFHVVILFTRSVCLSCDSSLALEAKRDRSLKLPWQDNNKNHQMRQFEPNSLTVVRGIDWERQGAGGVMKDRI